MLIVTQTVLVVAVAFLLAATPFANASKLNGERCLRDGECASGECKKFQCTIRLKPKGVLGDRCVVDGDCKSDECKKLRCVTNEYKQAK